MDYTKIIKRPKHNMCLATYRVNNEDRAFLVPSYDCDFLLMKVSTSETNKELEIIDETYLPTKSEYSLLFKLGFLTFRLVEKEIIIRDLPLILMGEADPKMEVFGIGKIIEYSSSSETLRESLISIYEKCVDYGMEISPIERRIFLHGHKEYSNFDDFTLRSLDSWYSKVNEPIPRISSLYR